MYRIWDTFTSLLNTGSHVAESTPRPFQPRLESFTEAWKGLIVLNNLITTSQVGNRIVGSLKRVSEPAIITLASGSGSRNASVQYALVGSLPQVGRLIGSFVEAALGNEMIIHHVSASESQILRSIHFTTPKVMNNSLHVLETNWRQYPGLPAQVTIMFRWREIWNPVLHLKKCLAFHNTKPRAPGLNHAWLPWTATTTERPIMLFT